LTQYSTQTDDFLNTNRNIYEVMYLANNANGDIVSTENPLPVTLGSESITIQGNISIPTSVEISNDVGNPIPVSRNTSVNSLSNPLYISGEIKTELGGASATSAFGEPLAISLTPVVQLDAIYGLNPQKFETYTAFGGNVDSDGPLMSCNSGTSQYGYGVIRSKRVVRYRAGQGALARFTAQFTTDGSGNGYTGYTQRAGLFNQEQALQIGYNGTRFGVLRQNGGKASIWRLTVTSAATTTSTVTLVLNGVTHTVTVPAGTLQENQRVISNTAFAGWITEGIESSVSFLSASVGPLAGAFTVSGTGTFAATLTQVQVGVAHTENWTYQEDFSVDTLDGNGPSGVTLDPSKLNVYQINFRWLGAGEIKYAIEDATTGDMVFFHHEHYTNRNNVPHLDNPSLKIGYVAASLSGTGTDVVVSGSSMMAAIEGTIQTTSFPDGAFASRSSGLNSAGTYYHMITLHNRLLLNNKINTREIILKSISAGATSAASTPIRIVMYRNATAAIDYVYQYQNETWSTAAYSTTETTINPAGKESIFTFLMSPGAAQTISLEELRIVLPPNDDISIAIVGSGVISQADVTLNWVED